MITSCMNSGFRLELSNGLVVSVQFSPKHHCSRAGDGERYAGRYILQWRSKDAEVCVFDGDRPLTHLFAKDSDGYIAAYQTADQVAEIIGKAQQWSRS